MWPAALTASLPTAPEGSRYSANISYYSTFPPSGAALSCSQVRIRVGGPPGRRGDVDRDRRPRAQYMESLVKITVAQAGASVFDQAVFVQGSASLSNDFNLDDASGQDSADMYTNGEPDLQ